MARYNNPRKPHLLPNLPALNQLLRIIDEIRNDPERHPYTSACWFTGCHTRAIPELAHARELPFATGGKADVLGYAGLDPWFIERGFITGPSGSVHAAYRRIGGQPFAEDDVPKGWAAVREFFGLNFSMGMLLFQRDRYPYGGCTPVAIQERLEHVLHLLEPHKNWLSDPYDYRTLAVPEFGGRLEHSTAGLTLRTSDPTPDDSERSELVTSN